MWPFFQSSFTAINFQLVMKYFFSAEENFLEKKPLEMCLLPSDCWMRTPQIQIEEAFKKDGLFGSGWRRTKAEGKHVLRWRKAYTAGAGLPDCLRECLIELTLIVCKSKKFLESFETYRLQPILINRWSNRSIQRYKPSMEDLIFRTGSTLTRYIKNYDDAKVAQNYESFNPEGRLRFRQGKPGHDVWKPL